MLMGELPNLAASHPSQKDAEQYIAMVDPLVRSCCDIGKLIDMY